LPSSNGEQHNSSGVKCPICKSELQVSNLHVGLNKCPSCKSEFEVEQ
jgi:transposase-like protein